MDYSLRHNLLTSIKAIILALLLSIGFSYIYAAWSNPTDAPPNANVPAPINVGSTLQSKTGPLQVNQLIGTVDVSAPELKALGGADPKITSPKFCIGASCITAWPSVPSGAIVFFAGACPSGWTTYTAASGRYIKANSAGTGTTGTDPFSHVHSYVGFSSENGTSYFSQTDSTAINVPYIELRACQAP